MLFTLLVSPSVFITVIHIYFFIRVFTYLIFLCHNDPYPSSSLSRHFPSFFYLVPWFCFHFLFRRNGFLQFRLPCCGLQIYFVAEYGKLVGQWGSKHNAILSFLLELNALHNKLELQTSVVQLTTLSSVFHAWCPSTLRLVTNTASMLRYGDPDGR